MHARLPIRCPVPGVVAAATALLLACSPIQDNNGNIPIAESMEKIAPGKQTREQVKETLGSPSAVGAFEANAVWYYIGKRTRTIAFLEPDVLEHQVVEIRFGADGRVSEVTTIDQGIPIRLARPKRAAPRKNSSSATGFRTRKNGRFSSSAERCPPPRRVN